MNYPIIKRFGDLGLLIEWSPQINEETFVHTSLLLKFLKAQKNLNIIETASTYYSVVTYFSEISTIDQTAIIISNWLKKNKKPALSSYGRCIEIPVCYDSSFGIDLDEISKQKSLPISEIIQIHTAPIYTVYFIGFLPGFPYLGGLNPKLIFPRKSKPRTMVQAGAVAIGGNQTGIYPSNSPGGWNIIGKTPISLFESDKVEPALLKAGDRLKFKSISLKKYREIEKQINNGTFKLTVQHD